MRISCGHASGRIEGMPARGFTKGQGHFNCTRSVPCQTDRRNRARQQRS